MASIARLESARPGPERVRLERRSRADAERLATFRVLLDPERERSLASLIEHEIIPRLMVAHTDAAPVTSTSSGCDVIDVADVAALVPLALQVEADALLDYVDAIIARGVTVEAVMVDLLAPGARLLGEYWEDDRCDFVDVTMALWRLQQIVHEIAARVPAARAAAAGGHRALFTAMPDDQHNFGTVVIDELFRRHGWVTDRLVVAATSDLLRHASSEWLDLIGLTVSCDCHIATLPSIIAALRNVSRNPRLCIMVGGRVFNDAPELAIRVGADGTARDAKLALTLATDLVRLREGEILATG